MFKINPRLLFIAALFLVVVGIFTIGNDLLAQVLSTTKTFSNSTITFTCSSGNCGVPVSTDSSWQTKIGSFNIVGNVGIGTASSVIDKLSVVGSLRLQGNQGAPIIWWYNPSNFTVQKLGYIQHGGNWEFKNLYPGGSIYFNTASTTLGFWMAGNGNISIGTSQAAEKLNVIGNIYTSGNLLAKQSVVTNTVIANSGLILKNSSGLVCAKVTIDEMAKLITTKVTCP